MHGIRTYARCIQQQQDTSAVEQQLPLCLPLLNLLSIVHIRIHYTYVDEYTLHTHTLSQACFDQTCECHVAVREERAKFCRDATNERSDVAPTQTMRKAHKLCFVLSEASVTVTKEAPRTRNPVARQANPEQPRTTGAGRFYLPLSRRTSRG